MKAKSWMETASVAVVAAFLGSLAVASTALAITIDFTNGSWDGADGLSSFTSHPSGVDLIATGGLLTVNYIGGPSGDGTGNDGLGINDDEITQGGTERLRIAFASPVTLNTVLITDLFKDEGPTGEDERGKYSVNGGAFNAFSSVGGVNGALTLTLNLSGVSYIDFKSSSDSWSDYSVKGLTYATPEPSSLLLLGCLMMALAFSMKRLSRSR